MFDSNFYIQRYNDLLVLRDLTPNTVKSYHSMQRMYLRCCQDCNKSPLEISFEEIRSYLLYLKQLKKLSSRSIHAPISQIRFLHLYVLHLSWNKYEIPYMKFDSKLPAILSTVEIHTFH